MCCRTLMGIAIQGIAMWPSIPLLNRRPTVMTPPFPSRPGRIASNHKPLQQLSPISLVFGALSARHTPSPRPLRTLRGTRELIMYSTTAYTAFHETIWLIQNTDQNSHCVKRSNPIRDSSTKTTSKDSTPGKRISKSTSSTPSTP